MPTLVLLRHGQSQWNLENRFTGWVDVNLTAEGEAQATRGGELIKAEGIEIDKAFTSVLTRAIRTCNLALEAAGLGETRRDLYRALARLGIGREAVVIAVKP